MGILSKFKKTDPVYKTFTGRQVSYIAMRVAADGGTVTDKVIASGGRIALTDGFIKITKNNEYIFICPEKTAKCNLLLSGNGVAVEGQNEVTGNYDKLIVYYNKL